MKVKELIENLSTLNQESEIVFNIDGELKPTGKKNNEQIITFERINGETVYLLSPYKKPDWQ